jgi:hypothetical protein
MEVPLNESPSSYTILQIDNVSKDTTFFEILISISPHITSIIGIFRNADYCNEINGTTIFLYGVNRTDAEQLETIPLKFNEDDSHTRAFIIDAIPKHVKIHKIVRKDLAFFNIPFTVIINGLLESEGQSALEFLAQLSKYFVNPPYLLTGLCLTYDFCVGKTNKYGFATFLRSRFDLINVEHILNGLKFTTKQIKNVPVLTVQHEYTAPNMTENDDIQEINLLCKILGGSSSETATVIATSSLHINNTPPKQYHNSCNKQHTKVIGKLIDSFLLDDVEDDDEDDEEDDDVEDDFDDNDDHDDDVENDDDDVEDEFDDNDDMERYDDVEE